MYENRYDSKVSWTRVNSFYLLTCTASRTQFIYSLLKQLIESRLIVKINTKNGTYFEKGKGKERGVIKGF